MALNYTTLQAAILDQALRPDLSTQCPGFVRLAEGLIRREVRAVETRLTLVEADRIAEGLYTLPDTAQEIRAVYAETSTGRTFPLENVGLHGIRSIDPSSDVLHYAMSGSTIEFRGVPATGAEFELVGFGWPAALSVTATNSLLDNHESLYLYGSLFHLYQFIQAPELAQNAMNIFQDAAFKVNAMTGRKIGGSSVLPAYNFGHIRTGRSF